MPTIARVTPDDPDLVALVAELLAHTAEVYPRAEDDASPHAATRGDVVFLLARLDGVAAGCCAVQEYAPAVFELKRMFVRPGLRGRGVSRALLTAAEDTARGLGGRRMVLETGERWAAAVRLYESAGFVRVANYPPYEDAPLSLCYAKPLTA